MGADSTALELLERTIVALERVASADLRHAAELAEVRSEIRRLGDAQALANQQRAALLERGEGAIPILIRAAEMADLLTEVRAHLGPPSTGADADAWWRGFWKFARSEVALKLLGLVGWALAAGLGVAQGLHLLGGQ